MSGPSAEPEKCLDEMVRDFCQVGPQPKSAVRQRIMDFAQCLVWAENEACERIVRSHFGKIGLISAAEEIRKRRNKDAEHSTPPAPAKYCGKIIDTAEWANQTTRLYCVKPVGHSGLCEAYVVATSPSQRPVAAPPSQPSEPALEEWVKKARLVKRNKHGELIYSYTASSVRLAMSMLLAAHPSPHAEPEKCPECESQYRDVRLDQPCGCCECENSWHDAAHSTPAAPQVFQGEFTPDLEWKPMASHSTPAAPAETLGTCKVGSLPHEYASREAWDGGSESHYCVDWRPVAAPPSQSSEPERKCYMCKQVINERPKCANCHQPIPSTHAESSQPSEPITFREALEAYVAWFGGAHTNGCPADDTCCCCYKIVNDAINKYLTHPSTHAEPSDERAAQLERMLAEYLTGDANSCPVCGWNLESEPTKGCTLGNCSFRCDDSYPGWANIKERQNRYESLKAFAHKVYEAGAARASLGRRK